MGIGFLAPAFLAALAALTVPLLLHLRHRDRNKPTRFPSFMFLERLTIRTESRQRLTDWPLLLLRLLALSLVVFAFARPLLKDRKLAGDAGNARVVVIMLDRSESMGYEGVWPRALDSARAIIDRLDSRDRVALIAYDDAAEVLSRLTEDHASVRGMLTAVRPLNRGTRLAPALRTARQVLLDAPFDVSEVVVVSDLQRSSAVGIAGVEFPSGVAVRGIAVGNDNWTNSAIRAVDARRVSEGGRQMLAVKARVESHGLSDTRALTASLTINGREAASMPATLRHEGETVITFAPVPAPDAAVALRVALSPADSLAADDTLFAVVPRDDALRVAMIAASGASASEDFYVEQALSIGNTPAMKVERLTNAPSTASALANTAVVMFNDVAPELNPALARWLEDGGGVVLAAGRRLAAEKNALPGYAGIRYSGLAERIGDRGGALRDIQVEQALFAPFREVPEALAAVRAWRYPRGDASPGAQVLAKFDDGLPAVLEQQIGLGRAVTINIPLDKQYGDFPLQPAFLPFMRQLIMHASGRDAAPLWHATGGNWALPATLRDPVVQSPSGELIRPEADSAGAAIPLSDAGFYSAYSERASGEPGALLAVNVPSSESELTPVDTAELLLGVRTAVPSAEGDAAGNVDAASTVEEMERRQNPWRLLLLAAVLVLFGETFLSTRGNRSVARHIVGRTAAGAEGKNLPADLHASGSAAGTARSSISSKEL